MAQTPVRPSSEIMRQLHTDHVNMARLLNVLEAELDRLAAGGSMDYPLALDVITYMTEYPDVYHHPKEDLLFSRWLQREPGVAGEELVDQLQFEHRSIARAGIHLLELLRGAAADVVQSRAELSAAARRYIDGQREHIRKEEAEVFPRVVAGLRDDDWREVDRRLASADDPLFGKQVGERFRQRYAQIRRMVEGADDNTSR